MIEYAVNLLADVDVDQKTLHIHFKAESSNAKYDICSMGGRIIEHGKLNSEVHHSIDLSRQLPGHYRLYILDAGKVHRTTFVL